ncbi:MAG: c-type cytochrome [Planctomycetes bacterium]|nr:c-type cytochrome [Planctomycetota bacterium]
MIKLPFYFAPPFFALIGVALSGDSKLPQDTLPADFGARIPECLVPDGFVDRPAAPEIAALGRALFFDPILSIDRTVSCASCHDPAHGFADGRVTSPGVRGANTLLHTPSLFNRGFGRRFSWTGHVESLEGQVLLPIPNGREMGLDLGDAVERLRADAHYGPRFEAAFGAPAGMKNLSTALTAFVSRIHTQESAVDRFQSGVFDALDDPERAGLWLYESKAGCWRCHVGKNYTDEDFHTTGIGARDGVALPARFEFSGEESDRGRFKTPTLRGLAHTAPYMHDGSLATLEDAVAYYRRGGNPNAQMDERIQPLALTDAEAASLVAFLRALSRPPAN